VVLRSVAFRDADRIVTLFTRDHGKLSALARGARSSKRRFGAGLGLFVVGRAELREGRGELWTLASFDVVREFTRVAADVAAMAHASYATELVRELTAAEQADAAVFDLLVELYGLLVERGPAPAVLRAFELALLAAVGLAPALDRCVACGDESDESLDAAGAVLDPSRGGLVCAACAASAAGPAVKPLPAPARALLLAAERAGSLAAAHPGAATVGDGAALAARDAMLAMLLAQIGKPLRSLEFISKMTAAATRRDAGPPAGGPTKRTVSARHP
jgi:DNA repair protein RecO (recombination protein O)